MDNKAEAHDFLGRFREIVSDPINLLIERHPLAGTTKDSFVYLHNGNLVPMSGTRAYYSSFSDILVINRGVHEPLEEYIFQEMIKKLQPAPIMLELGAYWGHYSMWLKQKYPKASVYLIEPDEGNLQVGINNFRQNNYKGTFTKAFVGKDGFTVDNFLMKKKYQKIDVLHSDIQGYELEMLEGASKALDRQQIDYVFVSTHSQELHESVVEKIENFGYRVEVSSDFAFHSTSYDGLVFASNPLAHKIFKQDIFLGREELVRTKVTDVLSRLLEISNYSK